MFLLSSTLGTYLMQLFADLHPIFTNKYLYHIYSDEILMCETFKGTLMQI